MEKNIRKYIIGSLAIAFLLTVFPLQTVAAMVLDEDITEEWKTEPYLNGDGAAENIMKEMDDSSNVQGSSIEDARAGDGQEDITAAFTDKNFRSLVREVLGVGKDGMITRSACASVTELKLHLGNYEFFSGDDWIFNVDGIEYFTNLEKLDCGINRFTKLDVSGCPDLQELDCAGNIIDSLNVTGCSKLRELICFDNRISTLDLNGCSSLQRLECHSGYLKNLDLSGCSELQELYGGGDQLESLDLSGCSKLQKIGIDNGFLTSMDVSFCTELQELSCGGKYLETLDISNCSNLLKLVCPEAKLKELDLDHCPKLKVLRCFDNDLTSLDLSGCSDLLDVWCYNNQIKNLNVSGCSVLEDLQCGNNELTSLDLSGCSGLKNLYCGGNQLSALDVGDCVVLEYLHCSENHLSSLYVENCLNLKELYCSYNDMRSPDDVKGAERIDQEDDFIFYPQNGNIKSSQDLKAIPASLTLYVGGESKTLKVSNAQGRVTYNSSNPKVARVDAKGRVTPLTKGTSTITVTAAGDDTYRPASVKVKVTVYGKPSKVKGIKAKPAKEKRTLKVSWKKVSSASGYIIKYSYKKNMKNSRSIQVKKGNSTSRMIKNLTSKRYVYIQIQAYEKDGKTLIKGAWSGTVKSNGKVR